MSMRLKGVLMGHLQAQLEQQLFQNAIVLQDVPCQMTFQSAQGYMEYETESHGYLPVFHMIGTITDIRFERGVVPYAISSLYFDQKDRPYMTKDILYYPSPDELAHMIQVGKFYTKDFKIPLQLDQNTYEFPAKVNLTILPPENEAEYMQLTYGGDFAAETDLQKINLPIVYLAMAGSGVNRKNDKLLDYYGIEVEDGYEMYPMTAEASGYVDPPLMKYITEPERQEEMQREDMSDMYITKEEEQQMMRESKERERAAQMAKEPERTDDYQIASPEDVLLVQADRSIAARVKERAQQQAQQTVQKTAEVQKDSGFDIEAELQDAMGYDHEKSAEPQSDMMKVLEKAQAGEFAETFVSEEKVPESASYDDSEFIDAPPEEFVETAKESVVQDVVAEEVKEEQIEKLTAPDVPQQQVDVKMDFNSEKNEFVQPDFDEKKEDGHAVVDEDSDQYALNDLQGADVADARLQAKVDEARAKDLAQDVAVATQQDEIEAEEQVENPQDEKHFDRPVKRMEQPVPRSKTLRAIPSSMQDIADEYDAARDSMMQDATEYQ